MNADLIDELEACTQLSYTATGAFPQIVTRLSAAGIEQYHADLCRGETTYYLPDGESHVASVAPVSEPIAAAFDGTAVQAAVRASQAESIDYPEFLRRIARAGCTSYFVSLAGRRATYLGRTSEAYVEHFPGAA